MQAPEPSSDRRKQDILRQALMRKTPIERAAFLDGACGIDAALRSEMESLLARETENQRTSERNAHAAGGRTEAGTAGLTPTLLDETPMTEGPGTVIGRYKLLEQIGEGGFGVVYLAEQREPVKRRVAMKIIKLGMDTRQVVARFEAERQSLALMDHPNIAKVFDGGATEAGRPYFVMELVRGIRITDYCDQNSLSTKERLDLFLKVCQAIQHAHQKGIIHRDIKPSNILVTLQEGVPVPKVIDFGIAKATAGQTLTDKTLFTAFEQFIGTPAYMSPEQAELSGLDIDTRSDIYSLGVLLYELLAGSTPFDAKELMASGIDAMRKTIREKEPVRPSTRLAMLQGEELTTTARCRSSEAPKLISLLQGDLDWIVMKCLEKDRTRRYETANGLSADLSRHLNDEPVLARPPSLGYRLQKSFRRNRLVFSAAGVGGLALVLGVVVISWQAVRATRAERNARHAEVKQSEERAAAQQNLYDSLVREARATRMARTVGYREEVFSLLRQAKGLDVPRKDLFDLRREAAACLGDFVGLKPSVIEDFPAEQAIWLARLDDSGRRAAFGLTDGTILLRELPSGSEVARYKTEHVATSLCFNVAGDRLISVHVPDVGFWGRRATSSQLAQSVVEVWSRRTDGSWSEAEKLELPGANECLSSAKGVYLTVVDLAAHSLKLLDLNTKALIQQFEVPQEMDLAPCTALSPDGQFFVIESQQPNEPGITQLDLWDLTNGQHTQHLSTGLRGDFQRLNFSVDGKYLSLMVESGGVIYQTTGFRALVEFKFGGNSLVSILPASTVIALSLEQQSRIRLWDLARHEDVAVLTEPYAASWIEFTRDGSCLLTCGGNQARIYRLDGATEKLSLSGHDGSAPGVAFSPDGSHLASVGIDRTFRIWDAATGRAVWTGSQLPGQGQFVCYSSDGRFLLTTDYETGTIWIWDVRSRKRVLEFGVKGDVRTWSARFSPDGKHLVTASESRPAGSAMRVWAIEEQDSRTPDAGLSAKLVKSFPGPWFCGDPLFTPDGRHFVFFDHRGLLYFWDVNEASPPRLLYDIAFESVQNLSLTPDGEGLVTLATNRDVVTLDLATGKRLNSFPTVDAKHSGQWTSSPNLCLSPDGTKLALSSASSLGVDLWDPKNGRLLYSLPVQEGTVYWLAWSPDSRRLAVSRANGDIAIWKLPDIERALAGLGLAP